MDTDASIRGQDFGYISREGWDGCQKVTIKETWDD